MKIKILLVVGLCLLAVNAMSQEMPPLTIPVCPGTESVMEMNLTAEELLALLPLIVPGATSDLDEDEIQAIQSALKDVKRIEFLQIESDKKDIDTAKLVSFYSQKIPDGEWTRVYYSKSDKPEILAIFSQAGANELYGYRVRTIKDGKKTVKTADVIRIVGRIDYPKLLNLVMPILMGEEPPKPQ